MTLIVIPFVAGLILLAFEVFVPGGVLGIMGIGALLGGVALTFLERGPAAGTMAFGLALVLVLALVAVELLILPRTTVGQRLFLKARITGTSAAQNTDEAPSLVGKAAVAATTLAPSGYVMIDGVRREAFSRAGFVEAGTPLKVVAVDNFRLIVTPDSPSTR
jgi:membrane-bound ClpP family serine protease